MAVIQKKYVTAIRCENTANPAFIQKKYVTAIRCENTANPAFLPFSGMSNGQGVLLGPEEVVHEQRELFNIA